MTKAVAKKKDQELALDTNMFEADSLANSGFEEADKDAYAIPFFQLLQKGSPQVDEDDGAYIEGTKPGMILNTVDETVFDGKLGITVIPVHYRRTFVEWVPRDEGGGFVQEHSAEDGLKLHTMVNDKNQDVLDNGNQLVDTRSHFVLVLTEDGGYVPGILAMTSTQMKKSRKWMSVMQGIRMKRKDGTMFTPPMFSHTYTVVSVPESNDKGTWHGFNVKVKGQLSDPLMYDAAKAFREAILSGEAKAAMDSVVDTVEEKEAF